MLQKESDLHAAAAGGAEDFKVGVCNGEDTALARIETHDQRMAIAGTPFDAFGVVEARRQQEICRFENRKTRERRVALKSRSVLAWREKLIADAFRPFFKCLAKRHVHAEPLTDFMRDAQVPGARHAFIDFVQAENIRGSNRFVLEALFQQRPTLPFLYIPRDDSNGLLPHRP